LRTHPRLPLHEGHFLVGVMRPGHGGDGVLSDACDAAGFAVRMFLPQARDELLAAKDPRPPFDEDFSAAQRERIVHRLQRVSTLQEHVTSVASDREVRLAETDAQILQLADIAVILQPKHRDGLGKPGRTNAFAEQALRSGKPLYALTFWIDENQKLHVYDELRYPRDLTWQAPRLSDVIPAPALTADELAPRIADACSQQATICRDACAGASRTTARNYGMLMGIASAIALLVGGFRASVPGDAAGLLVLAALSALIPGVIALRRVVSTAVSKVETRRRWTDLQLAADIARSVLAFSPVVADAARPVFPGQPHRFEFLFAAPLPAEARVLARTLAVDHLRRLRGVRPLAWEDVRHRYLRERLAPCIAAYRTKLDDVQHHTTSVRRQLAGLGALTAVLLIVIVMLPAAANAIAGAAATALALLALLSSAVALALHAHGCLIKHRLRAAACVDLLGRLEPLSQHIDRAPNEHAFLQHQADAESQLLAATLDWYRWRRRDQ